MDGIPPERYIHTGLTGGPEAAQFRLHVKEERMAGSITVERLVQELEKLKTQMDAGELKHSEYDQRLSRVISELRERGIDADRAAITAALDGLLQKGTIVPSVKQHLEKRLGLTS